MKTTNSMAPGQRAPGRKLQIMDETIHDPYQAKGKIHEPAACTECGAVYLKGRWLWAASPPHAHKMLCPACHRIHDNFPAGFLTIEGKYASEHREELLRIARHHAEREKGEHPLQRIMNIAQSPEHVLITTTDIHLARGIGEALHSAHQGDLEFQYERGQYLLRVNWRR
jgi:NMD protein affecting ribosome stability and mRNA decay